MAVLRALALWSVFCAGGALEGSASGSIKAFAGQTVVLPCHINASDEVPTVEWSKTGLEKLVFLYRDGCETYDMKDQVFLYRTNLFLDKLNSGNFSLMILNVQPSDTGTYMCILPSRTPRVVATWKLDVVAVSEPKLSVVPAVDGGVTLLCEVDCWFPKPDIDFLDIEEKPISAEDPKIHQVSKECFTVSRRLTLQTHSERVTCRVQHPELGQVKRADIHIPAECMKSCIIPAIIAAAAAAAAASVAVCGLILAFLACKKCGGCAEGPKLPVSRQSSDQSTTTCSSAGGVSQINQADNFKNTNAELQKKINELMSDLREKEETIHQQTAELNDLRSKQSPVVCQLDRPTLDSSPSKPAQDAPKPPTLPPQQVLHNTPKPEASTSSSRPINVTVPKSKDLKPAVPTQSSALHPLIQGSSYNYSSPALLMHSSSSPTSSPTAGAPPQSTVARSQSMSEYRPRARPQRRHTTQILVNNRFTVLQDLPEDSEPLLK